MRAKLTDEKVCEHCWGTGYEVRKSRNGYEYSVPCKRSLEKQIKMQVDEERTRIKEHHGEPLDASVLVRIWKHTHNF